MVDLSMPDGMSDEERVRWLRETGAALARETGQPSGYAEQPQGEHGQPVWAFWWTEDDADQATDAAGATGESDHSS
jgi:hypothetical protein